MKIKIISNILSIAILLLSCNFIVSFAQDTEPLNMAIIAEDNFANYAPESGHISLDETVMASLNGGIGFSDNWNASGEIGSYRLQIVGTAATLFSTYRGPQMSRTLSAPIDLSEKNEVEITFKAFEQSASSAYTSYSVIRLLDSEGANIVEFGRNAKIENVYGEEIFLKNGIAVDSGVVRENPRRKKEIPSTYDP